ncbi:MAG: T9SS type A sorting domain-containing protein [Paludibacter sp.]|nr:T9SS type A sorting domain-containing protein [Paludibacter sp.]
MKKVYLLLVFLITVFILSKAQTILKPGDVAIVQVNYSYQYSFDFVILKEIEPGTQIWFTDYIYSDSLKHLDETSSSDGRYLYTAPEKIQAGTVIQTADNANIQRYGSSLSFRSYRNSYALTGENLISYQVNSGDTTYLTAFGWMRQNNFAPGTTAQHKYSDIPPGLSFADHTVIQMDSICYGINNTLARDFKYNKSGGFYGTPDKIREWLSDTDNYTIYSGKYGNDPVSNFTVIGPDSLNTALVSTSPENNEENVSIKTDVRLIFMQDVEVTKDITIRNLSTQSTSYILSQEMLISQESVTELTTGSAVSFSLANRIEPSQNYAIEIPRGAINCKYGGTPWPQNDTIFNFTTSARRSYVNIDFSVDKRENCIWTTDSVKERYGDYYLYGYWDYEIRGIPMRFYTTEYSETGSSPQFNTFGYNDYLFLGGRLVVDLSKIENTITGVWSELYENNCAMITTLYSNGAVVDSRTITGSNNLPAGDDGMYHVPQFIKIDDGNKIDSIEYSSPEGIAYKMQLELIDLAAPQVDLGDNIKICRGDSVQLNAGFIPGVEYIWSNNATTSKIWVKDAGDYSVTVKNTLGQATDTVNVQVLEPIVTILPDTIYACPGDTVTLVAGDNNYGYFWSVRYPQDTPVRKVTAPGLYQVIISNSACAVIDSVRVIYQGGAKFSASYLQGGIAGSDDVVGQLYRRDADSKFKLYASGLMPQFIAFDSIPAGEYIFKAHFVSYSFGAKNPYYDTYHDGSYVWTSVTPFTLSCESDTTINFLMAGKPVDVEFNGTATISGMVSVIPKQNNVRSEMRKLIEIAPDECDTKVLLYDSNHQIISTTCPDVSGNFSFTNLTQGEYSIGIERTGFEVENLFSATVAEGETISNVNFVVNEEEQNITCSTVTGTKETALSFNISVYPNPVKDIGIVKIQSIGNSDGTIELVNLCGQVIKQMNIFVVQGENVYNIDMPGFVGLYLLRVSMADGSVVIQKITVK